MHLYIMKRTQLIKVFGVKDSFISLLTRAKFLKEFKPGVGKSIDYDQKKICLILIGFEMHKIGIAFRHIDEYLGHLNNRAWRSLLPRFQLWDKIVFIPYTSNKDENIKIWIESSKKIKKLIETSTKEKEISEIRQHGVEKYKPKDFLLAQPLTATNLSKLIKYHGDNMGSFFVINIGKIVKEVLDSS